MPIFQGISSGSGVDLFLKVASATSGPVKGEASDDSANGAHADEIILDGWSWGATIPSGRSGAGGRVSSARQLKNLSVFKQVDASSLPLAANMINNSDLREVKLTARKAGGTQLEFLVIELKRARVVNYEIACGEDGSGGTHELFEFSYREITLTYTPQGPDGQPRGQITQSFTVPSGDF